MSKEKEVQGGFSFGQYDDEGEEFKRKRKYSNKRFKQCSNSTRRSG